MLKRISTRSWKEIRKHLRRDARRFSIFVRSFFYFILATSIFFVWAVHDFIWQCSERSGSWEHRVDEQWNYQAQHRLDWLSAIWPYWTLWFWFQFPIATTESESRNKVKEHKMTSTAKKWWQRAAALETKSDFFSFKRATSKDTRESELWSNWITFFFLLHSILNDPCHRHVNDHSDWNVKFHWKVILIELNGKREEQHAENCH